MGILVEGKPAKDTIADVAAGKFDAEIKSEKTELSAEEMKQLDEEKQKLTADLAKRMDEFTAKAKETISAMQGKDKKVIKLKLHELKIPESIINELLPPEIGEGAAAPGAPGAAAAKPGAAPAGKK
jgi:predicted secreted protein